MMTDKALQDNVNWICYGCGTDNPFGLKLKSYDKSDRYVCEWIADSKFVAHPGKYHHGLVTTLCFCHGVWAATAESYKTSKKELVDPLEYVYVNQSINYNIIAPIPLNVSADVNSQIFAAE